MNQSKSKISFRRSVIIYTVLTVLALIWMYPIIIALMKSFTIEGLNNYKYVLTYEKINYFRVICNSLIIAIVTSVGVAAVTTLAGYAFSKMHFRGQRFLFIAVLVCLALPVAAVTMPIFFTLVKLKCIDSLIGVIIPLIAFNVPQMLLIVKNYFEGIPNELLESAKIDGASTFRTYRVIMLPLAKPILASTMVLTFVYSWNDYLVPLLIIRSESNYTVTLAAQFFMASTYQSPLDVAHLYAAMILLTLPSVIIYLLSQKHLQAGITAGAVKG